MSNVSIGDIGGDPYDDVANGRLKGFSTCVHMDVRGVEEEIHQALSRINGQSRFTFRTFVDNSIPLAVLRHLRVNGGPITVQSEASIPIGSIGAMVVYLGGNLPERTSTREVFVQQHELLRQVTERSYKTRSLDGGFVLESAWPGSPWGDSVVADLAIIYKSAFVDYLVSFTTESIRGMLKGNLVAVVRDKHTRMVVSVAMAEIADIRLQTGQRLRIAEISEVATHQGYYSRGFARVLYQHLVRELKCYSIDLIYTEARANHAPIMAAACGAGLMPCGYLPGHCCISSKRLEVEQSGKFGDLVVMALPQHQNAVDPSR